MPKKKRPSVESYVDDAVRFTDGIEAAVKAYAKSKPWRGNHDEQVAKLRVLHLKLCEACEVACGFEPVPIDTHMALCGYFPSDATIRVAGRISVTTYLFSFAAVLYGENEAQQMTFAVNLYKRAFPRSFRKADLSGPIIRAGK